jgi:hypothetical protein
VVFADHISLHCAELLLDHGRSSISVSSVRVMEAVISLLSLLVACRY